MSDLNQPGRTDGVQGDDTPPAGDPAARNENAGSGSQPPEDIEAAVEDASRAAAAGQPD